VKSVGIFCGAQWSWLAYGELQRFNVRGLCLPGLLTQRLLAAFANSALNQRCHFLGFVSTSRVTVPMLLGVFYFPPTKAILDTAKCDVKSPSPTPVTK
jgi:hypothetical protein